MPAVDVAAFYQFAPLADPEGLRPVLHALCADNGIGGTILLAAEGINGTVAGAPGVMQAVMAQIGEITGLGPLPVKWSAAPEMPFLRLKVKVKAEIVTLGVPVDPTRQVGTYVAPEDWNALLADPDVIVIDTRNAFEVAVGSFRGAIDPETTAFSEFPDYVRANLDPARHRKVAMFCTGGIRCEKASSYMLQQGFEEVFHLQGGILNYLEKIPADQSLWQGGCFVFDQRVAVGHGLAVDPTPVCHGCRVPLKPEDLTHPAYEEGVSCPHCTDRMSAAQKASARERWRQVQLAAARGGQHLGPARTPRT